ncbi:MAG: signal recognition particle protein [Acholeplasmatales bacterium]|nr:signal recognition particle protein [Acholeplasmataceae bacterium]MDY0115098.1 signal recognition particle protein [Acholeplasmatales bacterium]MCK9234413.1 signal recognition particle protein [Acholeplasmataceae bacterium]MCK9289151.1 signal recognition particle protein [Acholeplasmataceae bacterium]MCK9427085.1 signal recognition particle protein [Acholeplasmataceae bacterium]
MAFENLSSRLQMALRRVTGRGALNEKDIEEMMREIRLSLLEADVNLKVIRTFLNNIKAEALGEKILKGLNPGQQVVKVVLDQLVETLGSETSELNLKKAGLSVLMTVGLQGSGKTTAIAKLGKQLKKDNKKVLFIAADVYRPAAIEQLETLGEQTAIFVYQEGLKKATDIVKNGLKHARENNFDVVIIDTAGRLEIDEEMMAELKAVKALSEPDEILLTLDAMMGQQAANVGLSFHEQLGCTGVIITKIDGDTRGGAALSIKEIAKIPIKFSSTGEKLTDFEVFHPERMAKRILGMGDVVTLVEEVSENITEAEAMSLMEKMMSGNYNYNDLLKQFKMIKRMGSLSRILGFLPGMRQLRKQMSEVDDNQLLRIEALVFSMTNKERENPNLIKKSYSRRKRIALGAGLTVNDVNKLIESLEAQSQMVKQIQSNPHAPFKANPPQKKRKGKGRNKRRFPF